MQKLQMKFYREKMGSEPNLVNISHALRLMVLDESNIESDSNHTLVTVFEELREKGSLQFNFLWTESKVFQLGSRGIWVGKSETMIAIHDFSTGLAILGVVAEEKVAMFASTCVESFIGLQACFRRRAIAVTLDTSICLDEETSVHILNEAKVSTVVCDKNQAIELVNLQKKLKTVKRVVYVSQECSSWSSNSQALSFKVVPEMNVQSFDHVRRLGTNKTARPAFPAPADIALIMYTRARTSLPQGVSITHKSLLTAVGGMSKILPHLCSNDVYFVHSPVSHILELLVETYIMVFGNGARIGYASRDPLINASELLRPTLVMAEPAVLDFIKESFRDTVNRRSRVCKALFNLGYSRLAKGMEAKGMEGSWFGDRGPE